MSPENLDNPLNLPIHTSISEKIDVTDFNRLFGSEKQQTILLTCKNQREAFKRTLEEKLINGIDIKTQPEFDYFKSLLAKYGITPNIGDIRFHSINGDVGITIKKVNNLLKIYNNPDSTQPYSKGPLLSEVGEIENGKFTETGTMTSLLWQEKDSRADNSEIPRDIGECRAEVKKEKSKKSTPPKPEKTSEAHIEYKIKKGDFLWKIIKGRYGLSDSPEDIRCVGNIIEKIKKDPRNKDLIKDETGKIFVGDILSLPKVVSFKYKGGKQKEFKLDEEAKKL